MTWIFGYGSLIWRPDFAYEARQKAVLSGYVRRFWQGSPDHRGTLDAPGRVVTLVPSLTGACEGVAFQVGLDQIPDILTALDHRESGGYMRVTRPVQLAGGREVIAHVYIADEANPHFMGPAPMEVMVEHIRRSRGPSGANIDYVLNLQQILESEGIVDGHVRGLAAALRAPEGLS